MSRKNRQIEIKAVWRRPLDEKLVVIALLGFVDQLQEEAGASVDASDVASGTPDVTATTPDGTEDATSEDGRDE